ncbi:zinc transporter ZupT, partial [Neisseria sp. P0015.S009]
AGMGGIGVFDLGVPNPIEYFDAQDTCFQEFKRRHIARVGLMAAFAITAQNFPEGLATFFATLENPGVGMPLALAIAIHNI